MPSVTEEDRFEGGKQEKGGRGESGRLGKHIAVAHKMVKAGKKTCSPLTAQGFDGT